MNLRSLNKIQHNDENNDRNKCNEKGNKVRKLNLYSETCFLYLDMVK